MPGDLGASPISRWVYEVSSFAAGEKHELRSLFFSIIIFQVRTQQILEILTGMV